MSGILTTIEIDSEIKKWLDWHCFDQETTFSKMINQVLELGRRCIENNEQPEELPRAQKLLIQSSMECLLLLQNAVSSEQQKAVRENAKAIIRKTLGSECKD